MTRFGKFLAPVAFLAAVTVTASAQPASAMIACNKSDECWHVHEYYVYRPEFGVTVHADNWRPGRHEHVRWRDHPGRGYWHSNIWIAF